MAGAFDKAAKDARAQAALLTQAAEILESATEAQKMLAGLEAQKTALEADLVERGRRLEQAEVEVKQAQGNVAHWKRTSAETVETLQKAVEQERARTAEMLGRLAEERTKAQIAHQKFLDGLAKEVEGARDRRAKALLELEAIKSRL